MKRICFNMYNSNNSTIISIISLIFRCFATRQWCQSFAGLGNSSHKVTANEPALEPDSNFQLNYMRNLDLALQVPTKTRWHPTCEKEQDKLLM